MVEDLHALDPASLSLVAELATAPDLPILMIVTSRPPDTGLSPQLAARTLARVSSAPGSVRQHLGPLAEPEVAALLGRVYPDHRLTPRLIRTVRARTGGNPYWLTELVAAVGAADPEALVDVPLPEHLRLVAEPPTLAPPGTRSWTARLTSRPTRRSARMSTMDLPNRTAARPASRSGNPTTAGPPAMPAEPARSDPSAANEPSLPARAMGSSPGPRARVDDDEPDLTAREREVLSCLAEGMSNKQVAQLLGISIRTVTVHVSNLLRKTRSASRTEAALWAVSRR